MITKVSNTIANLKNLWIEMFLNKTDKVSNIADGSVLNAVAFGTAKVAQKAIKDIAIVEAQIFPTSATGTYLDKSAALFGVSPRKQALGSSTYIRVYAEPGTLYEVGTTFVSKNGIRFIVDKPFTVDNSGYGYVSVRSVITGSATNVEANSITQVSPRPLTHIECTNEYAAIGGRDYEDDETFRNRIINYNNRLSEETVESWTQIFQDLDDRILKVMNVGLGEDGKTHIYLVTQNGSFFTDDELEELLDKATPYFGLTELNLSGESIGIVLENAKWMYVGGEQGVDFRVELSPNTDIADARKNIQIAMTKYLDFRFWEAGKVVQWDDLLQVVKTAEGVKYVPDEYFFPYFDEEVPLNMLPRIKGFRMRDLEGNILYDSGSNLSNIFYPAGESDIYKGTQSAILSQKYLVSFTVTTLKNVAVPGAFITIGNKVITTDESGIANVLLENGEYTYTLNKANWVQQTGEFVVLNGPIFITINNFEATPYKVTFTIYEGEAPMEGAQIKVGINTLETDDTGIASVDLEPGTYSYTVSKAGFKTIESVLTVENKPVEIFERMFLESLTVTVTVNFAVIDRRRSIYVPQADITVTNITQKTDDEGQAQIGLQAGQYEMRVMKEGYQEYKNTIEVVGEKPNCVLVELDAIHYEIKFTVLDSENDMVIPNATVSINESTYLTDEHGVVIVSLPNGTFTYTVFRSGYMSYSDFIVMDDAPISKIIKLNKAFYTLKLIVRDIENGNYIQGAELNINEETKITNINGVATVTLGNGTYDYVVTQRNYKRYTGQIIIKDQDVVETIYLELRDTVITYTATDAITKAPISGVYIELINKGTGIKVDSGYTNDIGVLQLGAEAGEYTWNATHRYYDAVENQSITLEKLKDIDLPFTMTRREIEPEVDVIENIPGVSGDATTVRFSGENTAETLSNDSYYYIVHTPENFVVPNKGVTFDLMEHVKTFRRAEIGGEDEPYDFASGGAELVFNVSNDEIASLEGTMLTVQPNVTRDAQPRTFYVDVTITTPVSQVTVKIAAEQKAALNFNPVKAGIVVSVKNMFNDNVREYTTNAAGKIFPEVMPGIDYQLTIKEKGFYENNGLLIKNWGFGASVPTLMEVTCSKKVELRVKQQNTLRPLEGAEITVSGMSLPQTATSGSDGSASVYISPIAMSYECTVAGHTDKTGTFTPPLSADYIDIIMGYAEITMTVNLKSMQPYESVAANCTVTVTSAWGGTPSQAYSFTGATNANGVFISKGNGQFNIPPGEYAITYGGGNSNFNSKTGNITLPENITISTTVVRRTISVGYTVKEIIPSISTTASNPVKAGMVLACYYNDNGESSGANVTTNANGDFVKTVYAGIAERFQIQPVTFYEGNGAVATLNYSDTRTKDLVYTCSKRIPVYITSNLYGELSGASVTFSGMSVNQTGTTDTDGIVQMYISPVNMSYSVSKQHYNTKTGNFKPTGTETRMDIELEAKEYPVTFHVSTQGVLPPDGILVRITNSVLPDLVFEGETNAEGTIVMQDVPAGEYTYEILAGEVSSDTFSHPQSESGTVLDVEIQYELINAGIQVSEVYGTAGRVYLSNQTITMTSKAGTIKLTLDENGYTNQLLIKGLEYTFTTDSYPAFYSNPTQSYTWTEDGVIWPFDLNVTSKITVNVKDVYVKNNIQGVTVAYNEQVVTTDASGNASLFRSALTKDYSLDKEDYSTVNGTIAPTTASPLNVTMLRNKHVVTAQQYEVIPGGSKLSINYTLTYTSAAGNGTINENKPFEAYLGIPITFILTAADRRPFYTNYQQTHTFTTADEVWDMNLTCAKQITVNVKDNVPGINVQGATVNYFTQIKTTDTSGNAVFYWSGVIRDISVSAANLESYTGRIAYNSPNPFNVVMTRATNPVTLVVREVTPAQTTYYQNLQIKYTAGSATGTLITDANGAVTFNGSIGTEMSFTVVGHPEFYSNPTQKHTYTAANQSWTMDLTVTAKITINVKSNVPSGTNLSGATVSYFHQTGTTDSSGNVSLYRSSVTRNVDITATYHGNYRGSITSDTASPFNVVMTRSTATVSLGVSEEVLFKSQYVLEIKTSTGATSPGLGGFSFRTLTSANKEYVVFSHAKIPTGYSLLFRSNETGTGGSATKRWLTDNKGTGVWTWYAHYIRCGASGSFNTTNFFYLDGGSKPVTWQIDTASVFDISGSNSQNKSYAEITQICTVDKMVSANKDFLFSNGNNDIRVYNNLNNGAVTITRKAFTSNTFGWTVALYSSMKMNFSPAASTSPLTLDTNGSVSFVCYLGTPVTFTPVTRPNYYSNPNNALTYTAAGQVRTIQLICNQKIVINTVANIYNINNALAGMITYFGQTLTSGGSFYRSGLDRQMTAMAYYFNNYVGTVTATQTSPYTVTMNRTTRTVTLIVRESVGSNEYTLSNAVIVRSVRSTSNVPAGEITLDANGRKTNNVYAGINYTYTPKNYASYYSNASQGHTWTDENEQWIMILNVTARLTFNIKSSNYGTNISGVSCSYLEQTGTTDSSGNFTIYRSGISRSYSFSKTNYNTLTGTLSAAQASPLNLKMSETSSSITITMKDYYQSAVKGNTNGCPITLTNKSLSSVTFSGTTNSSGQVSFGPMIVGSYTLSWGGGTSYWVAGSTTITMPTATTTQNAVRLTKSVGVEFRVKIPLSTPVLGWWGTPNLVKSVFTTAGVATTVSLTANNAVYYLATYTWIAGITTTITAKLANYFVTGTTTTETPYSITPNYNFSNIGHNNDATAFYSTAIKSIVVTVQNSYTNAAVSGVTINMYSINGSYQTSGELGAGQATQTVTTNSAGRATVYVSGLTNRYVVSATRYVTLNTTNTNTSNFTIKLVPSDVTITITVNDVNTGTSVGSGCIVKLSSNNTSTAYSGTTNTSGQVVLTIKPGNYWWEAGGSTTWGASGTGTWNYPNRSTTSISLIKDQSITIEALKVGVWVTNFATYTNMNVAGAYPQLAYVGLGRGDIDYDKPNNNQSFIMDVMPEYSVNGTRNKVGLFYGHSSLGMDDVMKFRVSFPNEQAGPSDMSGNIVNTSGESYESFLFIASRPLEYGVYDDRMCTIFYGIFVRGDYSVPFFTLNSLSIRNTQNSSLSKRWSYSSLTSDYVDIRFCNMFNVHRYMCQFSDFSESEIFGLDYSYYINQGRYFNPSRFYFLINSMSNIFYINNDNESITIECDKKYYIPFFKKIYGKYDGTNKKAEIVIAVNSLRDSNNTSGIWTLSFLVYDGGTNYLDSSNWFMRENVPTTISEDIGCNVWIPSNLKWVFFLPKMTGDSSGNGVKGLNTIKSTTNIVDKTGWISSTYYKNDDSTLDLRNAVANKYVLEIIFNKNSNKMIVLCNDTKGIMGTSEISNYIQAVNPTSIFAFTYNGRKWVQMNQSLIGLTEIWNTYQNSKSGNDISYMPPFNIFPNYEDKLKISYIYPSYQESGLYTAYQGELTFGD